MILIKEYNREFAVAYAKRWALARNPLFFDFKGYGGDCTNYISQCVYAGSCEMNFTPTFGWYYISSSERSAAWTGVEYFYNFMTTNEGVGPFCREVSESDLELGDVIQLADQNDDFYHTLIVTGFDENTYLVSAHTNDVLDRRLDTYNYAYARFLHIEGVRFEYTGNDEQYHCFYKLIGGITNSLEREIGGEGGDPDLPT